MIWLRTLLFTVLYPGTVCVGIPTAILWVDLLYEEPELRRLFGERFEAYRARIPRWLWRL